MIKKLLRKRRTKVIDKAYWEQVHFENKGINRKLWEVTTLNGMTTTVPIKSFVVEENTFNVHYDVDRKVIYYVVTYGLGPTRQEMYSRTKEHWKDNFELLKYKFPYTSDFKKGYGPENIQGLNVEDYIDWFTKDGWKAYVIV